MLTLFVLKSGKQSTSKQLLLGSFVDKDREVIYSKVEDIDRISEINLIEKTTDWYGVFYDNERIDPYLADSLFVYFTYNNFSLKNKPYDFLVIHKKDKNTVVTKCPRFFRNNVKLQKDSLMPKNIKTLTGESPLDGWILEQ